MPSPDTAFVKQWCRIDGAEFDTILPTLIASATTLACHETGVDYLTTEMPEPVKVWCAAQVAYWLSNPEAGSDKKILQSPFHLGLLDPFRTYA